MRDVERPRGMVRQGGKEELRASLLKTYLLRVRKEKGERAVSTILSIAGIDPSMVDNETGWVSTSAARRALKGIAEALGSIDALRHRGEYVTHPEALGALVRMLRTVEQPIDAYVYLADNAREVTRVGSWEIEFVGALSASKPSSSSNAEKADAARKLPKNKASVRAVRLTYKPRNDGQDDTETINVDAETLFCAAREGELAALPCIWGLGEARISHETCLASGGEFCSYLVEWVPTARKNMMVLAALGASVLSGGAIGFAGGSVAGLLGAAIAGALGAGAGRMWDQAKTQAAARIFERNRIAALERGLDLRGEATVAAVPGELTGTVLGGKYRIGQKIGSGGIGVVYAAEHTTLGHQVAVKVLRGAAARDGGEIARLRREAYIQFNIDSVNVCRVHDLDQTPDGSLYVVMERLHGRSLADKLAPEHVVAPGFAIPVFIGVCRALAAAHRTGVIHRDLKPGNIFLCDDGTAKVLDFGMSKLTTAESLTMAGYTLGTPEYMAPEQCIGGQVVPQTDLYAFGVLMYEALTGELPIVAQSRRDLLDLHQRKVPSPMRQRRPDLDIPEALDQVVMMCLKKRINDRPASAEDLEAMLAAIPTAGLPTSYGTRGLPPLKVTAEGETLPTISRRSDG